MLRSVTQKQISALAERYYQAGGMVYTIEGTLNDNYIMSAPGKKTTIIREQYLNNWSSCNVIRMYNRCPMKYRQIMDFLEGGEIARAENLFFS